MLPFTDMHCHILPGVDDGSASMEETLTWLSTVKAQGVNSAIVTPHFHPGRYIVPADTVRRKLEEVQDACAKNGIDFTFWPGQECYWYSGLLEELKKGNVLTLAGTRYVLVEFEPMAMFSVLTQAVRSLLQAGYRPIIAHFERYQCLDKHRERLEQLKDEGAKLQTNLDTLMEPEGLFRKNQWRRLLLDGYVDYLGSDSHGMHFRPPHFDEALAWVEKKVPQELQQRLLRDNLQKITGK